MMSEDLFESLLPPVKANIDLTREEHAEPITVITDGITDKSSTDISKLWEEIYMTDDSAFVENKSGEQIQSLQLPPSIMNASLAKRIIPFNRTTTGLSSVPPPIGSNGKVLIVPNKRKTQLPDIPAKTMRIAPTAGNESRRILQTMMQNRSLGLAQAPPPPVMLVEAHEDEQEDDAETHAEIYAQYQPAKLREGRVHPYPVVESSSLSSVEVPNIRYRLHLPEPMITQGRLSNVQLEAVIYACQRHEEILPTGMRAGYLIGDGAGVGKGRTLAAIIYENYELGRKRSIWISVSNDLRHDAERDLNDLGANIHIHALNKLKYSKISSGEHGVKKGVLFSTYASLIGECQNPSKSKYSTRFRQITHWFGKDYDGVVVFDECHKAKNLMPQGSQKKTKTAEIVLKLQEALPMARVVYASATGASEPRNMAYMTRLGLWGKGTPFSKFEDFVEKLEDKVGAMELVAVDMKQRGMYIARQLSFTNVKFRVHEVKLADVKIGEHAFLDVYNDSVDLWARIFERMVRVFSSKKQICKKHTKTIWGQYWAAHQRFFKYLCMAGKVQECVRITMDAITEHKCVVIGLQSTGEAKTNEMIEEFGSDQNDFVSCASGILHSFVERFFPTDDVLAQMDRREERNKAQPGRPGRKKGSGGGGKKPLSLHDVLDRDFLDRVEEEDGGGSSSGGDNTAAGDTDSDLDSDDSLSSERPSNRRRGGRGRNNDDEFDDDDVEGFFERLQGRFDSGSISSASTDVSAKLIQRELIDEVDKLAPRLPINTLDDLIRELGGPDYVAEMTGRKGRMVMDVNTGVVTYQPRREDDVTLEQVNLVEKERFNSCHKLVAIISDAASTGISLHADKRYQNPLQRVHITLELPWSADRAIQQFGRTHRSNQETPPEYVFLISDLAGERRFASTVAKRLESLGALTHGDRRATETRDLSQFNIDNKFGRRALDSLFDVAFRRRSSLVPMPVDIDLGAALEAVGLQPKDSKNVSKFLNRILGMRLDLQNALFQYYTDTMDELIRQAKRNQEFDRGIIDLAKEDDNIFVEESEDFVMQFLGDDTKVTLHKVKNITGMSWHQALEVQRSSPSSEFYLTRSETQRKVVLAVQKKDRSSSRGGDAWYTLYSPNIGEQTNLMEMRTLTAGYRKASLEEVERVWTDIYQVTEHRCLHFYWNRYCKNRTCDVGCRSKLRNVLSGSIFYIWDIISNLQKSPQLARVRLNDGTKIIGCIISPTNKDKLIEILKNRNNPNSTVGNHTAGAASKMPSSAHYNRSATPRMARPSPVPPLTPSDQFFLSQNIRNIRPPPQLVSGTGRHVVAAPQNRIILRQAPALQSPMRVVPVQNVLSPATVRIGPASIRLISPMTPQHVPFQHLSFQNNISNNRLPQQQQKTTTIDLTNGFIEYID